jgi:hypothetical protein
MGSAFDAVFQRCARPAHLSFNGEEVVYTPRGGTALNTRGAWLPGKFLAVVSSDRGRTETADGKLTLSRVFFDDNEIEPKEGDSVRIVAEGKTYSLIADVEDIGGGMLELALSSTTYSEKSDGGTRRKPQ